MERRTTRPTRALPLVLGAALALTWAGRAEAEILGVKASSFTLAARADYVSTGDGGTYLFWGYAQGIQRAQYPGPTLIVNEGATITIDLTNKLPLVYGQMVSIVFPGHEGVSASCLVGPCAPGLLALEAGLNGTVRYTFVASRPGTFLYHSGTRPELQVEMGLTGAIIVRPAGYSDADPATWRAYGSAGSAYDREFLFFLSEMDPRIHDTVDFLGVAALESTDYLSDYFSNYWFLNGRTAPDSMAPAGGLLPTQPYNCLPRMHPGERLLMRVVGGGRQMHPFHHHGNHALVIARDAHPLETAPGTLNLSFEVFTIQSLPGATHDAIFTWTGKDLGWDVYGHEQDINVPPLLDFPGPGDVDHNGNGILDNVASEPNEWIPDHGKPFPVVLPELQNLTFGGFYSGSPFLGILGSLPPGEGGLNPTAGYAHMWHSHTEKELTNFDVFPGGMMTMLIVEAPSVPIP